LPEGTLVIYLSVAPMRRLENEEEGKFWEAWIKDEAIFCYRFGKLGSQGHIKLKKFKTRAEAEAELEAKLAEKLDEGFVEPEAAEAELQEEGDTEQDSDEDGSEQDDSAEEDDEDEAEDDEESADEDEAEDDEESADEDEAEDDEESADEDEAEDDEESSDGDDEVTEDSDDDENDEGEDSEDGEGDDGEESDDEDDAETEDEDDAETEDEDDAETEDEDDAETEDEDGEGDDGEEPDDEDEAEDEDEPAAAPRGRNRSAPLVVDAAPPKPTLPPRVKARVPSPAQVALAVATLSAVHEASSARCRSWKLGRLVKRARAALEQLGGSDLTQYEEAASALARVMSRVIAPKRPLSLEQALSLLWVVDGESYARTVVAWRAKMLNLPTALEIGLLSATLDHVPDREVAIHVGTALARHSSPEAFRHWFARLKPFLAEALAGKGGLEAFRSQLKPGSNERLKARVAEVTP
jgi:predicted DNA-binding WGR domain protein